MNEPRGGEPEHIKDLVWKELARMRRAKRLPKHSVAVTDPAKLLAKANLRIPMSQREVAAMVGVTHTTVKQTERRAKAKIIKALRPARGEEVRDGE